ncbi:peptidase inhibitor 16-like [Mugil cephalus]|uniref:peptidase inhibitor 16-like n=1 Tax=Mugil cephalus TaxID=48193 RepID=UPI001FB69545|nr:peptidase inhibitor 16-like [Mugil cephalus]
MHQRSLLELHEVATQSGAPTPRTTQDGDSRSSRPRRESGRLCPPRVTPLWAWLLLGALVVPGAWSFLTEVQEEMLVELHNHYRGQVSPSASAMLPLRWDPALKLVAEGYAAKCIWNHNPDLEDTGENLFAGTGSLDLSAAMEKWFLEHLDYDFQNNSCDEDKMCGHYTQMVWADTHRVGCAFHLCNTMEGLDWERVFFLVCNYFPAGNYEDQRPYVEGDWCSQCPENMQKCENNLCVLEEYEDFTSSPPSTDSPDQFTDTLPPATSEDTTQTQGTPTAEDATTDEDATTTEDATSAEDATPPPEAPSPTQESEEMTEVDTDETEATERNKSSGKEKPVRKTDRQQTNTSNKAGSVSSPPVLLACLTAIMTLRL